MGPYLGTPKKEKNSEDGENDKVSYNALHENSCAGELVGCKVGEIQWRTLISQR